MSIVQTRTRNDLSDHATIDIDIDVHSNLTHQRTTSTGLRLLQYSLEEFFYPNLTILVSSTVPPASRLSTLVRRALVLLLCLMPLLLALLNVADKQLLAAELIRERQSLESCSAALQAPVEALEPVVVTLTTTMISATTMTATATHVTTVYATAPTPTAAWDPQDDSVLFSESSTAEAMSTAEALVSTSAAPQYVPNIEPTVASSKPLSTPYPLPDEPSTPSASASSTETTVSSFLDMSFFLPIRFDVPSIRLPSAARATVVSLWRGMGVAWWIVQKVIHYPLDPP